MYDDINYPIFKDQDKKLKSLIYSKMPKYLELCEPYEIDKSRFMDQVEKEYKMITESGLSGLYYCLGIAFEPVKSIDIIAYGASGGAVIPNILNLTGAGVKRRLEGIFLAPQRYYPELFYGLNDARLVPNPSCIRLSNDSYLKIIRRICDVLDESENWKDKTNWRELRDIFVQRSMGLMFSSMNTYEEFEKSEQQSAFPVEMIPLDDPDTLKVFCDGSINEPGDTVRIRMVDEGLKKVLMRVQPSTVEDISYAIGLCIVNNIIPECSPTEDTINSIEIEPSDSPKRMEVFRERYLKESIVSNDPDEFNRLRKECIKLQRFPRVHVDSIAMKYYQLAYYQVHYPKLRIMNPAHNTTDDSRVQRWI